jgi:hypothetical protein
MVFPPLSRNATPNPALRRLRKENHEFKASLGYLVRPIKRKKDREKRGRERERKGEKDQIKYKLDGYNPGELALPLNLVKL